MSDWWSADPVVDRRGQSGQPRIEVRPSKSDDFWSQDTVKQPVGVWEDIGRSIPAGIARGVAGLAGLPDAVGTIGAKGIDRLTQLAAGALPGNIDASRPSGPTLMTLPTTAGATEYIEKNVTGPLYESQTRPGRFAGTAAEFVPGAVLGPANGAAGIIGNIVKYGVIPGLTSEGAGQVAEATIPELAPYARVAGAFTGAGAAALATRPGTAAKAIRQQLPEGVTPQMVDHASVLIDDAARSGVNLSWPEALSQVAGRPVMTNTLRHLEAAPQTEARMAEFFGDRAPAINNAARQQFDNVAPVNQQPSSIGPAVGQRAEDVLQRERDLINLATEPEYAAASTVRLTPQEMARVQALPGYAEARAAVRNDPQLNRYVANLPDDSVGFLNEVKKQLDQAGTNAAAPLAQNPNMQRAAGLRSDASAVRDAGTRASPDYAVALSEQERLRAQYLEPLMNGPIGKIAGKDTTTKAAIDALFPTKPLANSEQEIGRTVADLGRRNPRVAQDLVRAHVEGTFNEAAQALQSGANQMGGAKFRSVLVGNPQQAANLEAAVRALPNGDQVWNGFNRFLEVLEATGTRQNVGSRTAYNAELLKGASGSGVVVEAAKGALNPLRGAAFLADKYERWRLGSNLNELADILTNPAAVGQLRAIARMPVNSSQALNVATRIGTLTRSATNSEPVQGSRE